MKIAFIVNKFPSLSETFILNQVTGLIDRGHDVEIMAASNGEEGKTHPDVQKYGLIGKTFYYGKYHENMPKMKVRRILEAAGLAASSPRRMPLFKSLDAVTFGVDGISLNSFYKLVPFLGKGPYDVVHCHFGPTGILGALLKHTGALAGKLVTTFHGYDMTSYVIAKGDRVYDLLFDKGDLFLPVSQTWKEKLLGMGCNGSKIRVHRMGIDTVRYKFNHRRMKRNGRITVLSVARLVEKKGIKYGLFAVAEVMRKHRGVSYTIAGDGPLKPELQEICRKTGIEDRVCFLGWRDQEEIESAMEDSDILLAPSVTATNGDSEGIPVVIMEALAMGMPVVSTVHSGIPEIIENGVCGFTVPERDINALSICLRHLIENPETASAMGAAGRKRIEEQYDINMLNDRLVESYRAIC